MTVIILSILLFLSSFAAVSFGVLYLRGKIITEKAENDTRLAQLEQSKAEEAYHKIKNAPKVVLEKAKFEAARIEEEAKAKALKILAKTTAESNQLINDTQIKAEKIISDTKDFRENTLAEVKAKTNQMTSEAKSKTMEMEGLAVKLEKIVRAYENKINGYGDEFLLPIENVIDEIGAELAYSESSKNLKETNKRIKDSIKNDQAIKTKFKEEGSKELTQVVLEAFVGQANSILSRIKNDNFGKLTQELIDLFILINKSGEAFKTEITKKFLDLYLEKLKWGSILQKIKKDQQEEQRIIRERIREEERVRREAEKAEREALKEEETIQKALAIAYEKIEKASEAEREKYEQQINELNARVIAAEEKRQRALSMAQQTKMGHVYVISNTGSFGEDVFKIGLTRRLEPQDRIDELGDSSVPFEFDVHAFIKSDDAPALEHQLHKIFVLNQVNKVNHRKEFFKVSISKIREEVEKLGLDANWTMKAEALQYRESLQIEKLIASNSDAKAKWVSRQLELDDLDMETGFSGEKVPDFEDDNE